MTLRNCNVTYHIRLLSWEREVLLLLLPPASSWHPGVVVMAAGVVASDGGDEVEMEGWVMFVGVSSELLPDELGSWPGLSL